MEGNVTLKMWHGGVLKSTPMGLQYYGGAGRTFSVDPDELCWFYLEELAMKCGKYTKIDEIHYLIPGEIMDVGLRRVYADKEVLEMAELAIKFRRIELYVMHCIDTEEQISYDEYYEWFDNRPDSPPSSTSQEAHGYISTLNVGAFQCN